MERMLGVMGQVLNNVLTGLSNSMHESQERQADQLTKVIERTVSRMDAQTANSTPFTCACNGPCAS